MTKITVLASMLIWGSILPNLKADECSNADLRGVYSFVAAGTILPSSGLPAGLLGPFAAAGRTIYDGNGSASGVIELSLNGTIIPSPVPPNPPSPPSTWTATYTVDPSTCTATKAITITSGPLKGVVLNFFISAGADFKELRFIATNPGTAISGTARKQ